MVLITLSNQDSAARGLAASIRGHKGQEATLLDVCSCIVLHRRSGGCKSKGCDGLFKRH